jgi:hypothetical protein
VWKRDANAISILNTMVTKCSNIEHGEWYGCWVVNEECNVSTHFMRQYRIVCNTSCFDL